MQKKAKEDQSNKALRVTAVVHRATRALAKKKKLSVDEVQRFLLRTAKVAVALCCAVLLRGADTAPVVSADIQLQGAKLHAEEMSLKQAQQEWQRRMMSLQSAEQDFVRKLTETCKAPKWQWKEVPDEIGTKFLCESAPVAAPAPKGAAPEKK